MKTYASGPLVAVGLLAIGLIIACFAHGHLRHAHKRIADAGSITPASIVVAHHNTQHSLGPCGTVPCPKDRPNGR